MRVHCSWVKAHQQILSYDFDHYVGGHLDYPGTRQDVLTQQEYVQDLFNMSKAAILQSAQGAHNGSNPLSFAGLIDPINKVDPNNFYAEVAIYSDYLAGYIANKSLEKWGDILAGCDIYGFSNAQAMGEALRLDWGILGPFGVAA